MKLNLKSIIAVFAVLAVAMPLALKAAPATIISCANFKDTTGNMIQAHGAGIIQVGNVYYWFGEDKSLQKATFNGINCYESTDLVNWKFDRKVLPVGAKNSDLGGKYVGERPKVIYNASTQQYVMYIHIDTPLTYTLAKVGVATCSTVNGTYTYQGSFQPVGEQSRDMTLFKDDDGKAYLIHSANSNKDTAIDLLSSNYLTAVSNVTTIFKGAQREAPCMVKSNGIYYLLTSTSTFWAPSQAMISTATNIAGPWSALQNIGSSTTYNSQGAYIISVSGSAATSYIFCGDSWNGDSSGNTWNIGNSRYVWLPLDLSGPTPALNYYDNWDIDTATGQYSAPLPTDMIVVNDSVVGTSDNQFQYFGSWGYSGQAGCYDGDNTWSNTTNDHYQISFTGVQVSLYASFAPTHAIAAISIDGGSETMVDFYSSYRNDGISVYSSPVLPYGHHTLNVRDTGTHYSSSTNYYITADKVDIDTGL